MTRTVRRLMLGAVVASVVLGGSASAWMPGAGSTAAAAAVSSDVEDFAFESLDADYTLGREADGTSTLRVVETFVAVFPESDQNRGMRRVIGDTFDGQPLDPEFVSITDGEGRERPAEVEDDDGEFSMTSRADDFVHGRQTYVFTYTLRHVTRFFADTGDDEFYWDVNGVDWPQEFGRVSASVTVPSELADALTGESACYVGFQGATDRCEIASDAGSDAAASGALVSASASPVLPNQTVTIAVGFEAGTFTSFDSSYLASPWGWVQAAGGLGLVGALIWAGVVRSRRLRDEPGRPTIIAEFTPPRGVDALESAVLLGRTTKAIPAEVLEQAVVGSIRIVEGKPKMFGGARLTAELVDASRADGDGRMLLDGLFPDKTPGSVYEFGKSDTRLSSAAQKILKAAEKELARRGLRRDVPTGARIGPMVAVLLAAAVVFVAGVITLDASVNAIVPVVLLVASIPAIFVAVGLVVRKPLTSSGAEVRDHLAGLKVFIEWAEADRIRMLQSPEGAERVRIDPDDPRQMLRLYESLLPYAVVFGQEREWSKQLVVLYGSTTPYWYVGTHGFDASSFSAGIGSLSASATSSSSSGGSGGGGSAGGGGGGGGGGGV